MPYSKNHIRVNVPKRSGFDKSHRNSGTGSCGTLIPILCDEVIPNTRVHLRVPIAAQMPPLASETYMNVKLKMEAFFVPMRLLCGSFESFFTDFPKRLALVSPGAAAPSGFADVPGLLPHLRIDTDNIASQNYFPAGSLGDYLGIGTGNIDTDSRGVGINLMPFLAYHKVWEDYYRNPRVQNPAFAPIARNSSEINPLRISACPFEFLHDEFSASGSSVAQVQNYYIVKNDVTALTADSRFSLADGTNLFSLRQRNFGLDYFTGARVDAQQGDAVSVSVPAAAEGESSSFSIASLRAANSLQQFRERNNLPSPRLIDQVKARYGAILSDGVAQRPICIGSATMDMYTHGVDQTADNSNEGTASSNPFDTVAAQYGRASVSGNELLIENFTANEPGYILVLMSQVPEVSYTLGVSPMFRRYLGPGSIVQMANPLLQNMGDQPIYVSELDGLQTAAVVDRVFGYQDRFADFMFIKNQIHGLFRDGNSLSSFVAQRALGSNVEMSSAFLEIPTDYLNGVLAVSNRVAGLTYWYDSYLDYKVSMPLAEFSIPSLQDPAYEHGESISLRRNGQIF